MEVFLKLANLFCEPNRFIFMLSYICIAHCALLARKSYCIGRVDEGNVIHYDDGVILRGHSLEVSRRRELNCSSLFLSSK